MKKTILTLLIITLLSLSIVSAFDTLSLSKIDFSSNDPDLNAPAFLLYAVENGRVDSAIFEPKILQSETGKKSRKKASIKSELTGYKLQYPLINDNFPLYKLEIVGYATYIPFLREETWAKTWCDGLSKAPIHFASKDTWTTAMRCIEINTVGYLGRVSSSPKTLFTDKITVTVEGESKSVELTERNQVDTEGKYVLARFVSMQGSLSGTPRPGESYEIIWRSDDNKWILADKALTTVYKGKIRQSITSKDDFKKVCDYFSSSISLDNCVSEINKLAIIPETSFSEYENNIVQSKESGSLILSNIPIYEYPSFTLKINAEWVGIYQPVGKPKIISTSSDCFTEGKSGKLVLKIKNDADVEASFNIGITCPTFKAINQDNVKFQANEEKEFPYYLTAETESKLEENCVIIVKDSTNPIIKDTTSQKVCVKEAVQCEPVGRQICNGKLIQECIKKDDVQIWKKLTTCDQECKANEKTQVPECVAGFECPIDTVKCSDGSCQKECPSKECKFSLLHPVKYLNCLLDQIKIYLAIGTGLIVALISFLMLYGMFGKGKKGNGVGIIISILIALILGAMVGLLLYYFINAAVYIIFGLLVLMIIAGMAYALIPRIPRRPIPKGR